MIETLIKAFQIAYPHDNLESFSALLAEIEPAVSEVLQQTQTKLPGAWLNTCTGLYMDGNSERPKEWFANLWRIIVLLVDNFPLLESVKFFCIPMEKFVEPGKESGSDRLEAIRFFMDMMGNKTVEDALQNPVEYVRQFFTYLLPIHEQLGVASIASLYFYLIFFLPDSIPPEKASAVAKAFREYVPPSFPDRLKDIFQIGYEMFSGERYTLLLPHCMNILAESPWQNKQAKINFLAQKINYFWAVLQKMFSIDCDDKARTSSCLEFLLGLIAHYMYSRTYYGELALLNSARLNGMPLMCFVYQEGDPLLLRLLIRLTYEPESLNEVRDLSFIAEMKKYWNEWWSALPVEQKKSKNSGHESLFLHILFTVIFNLPPVHRTKVVNEISQVFNDTKIIDSDTLSKWKALCLPQMDDRGKRIQLLRCIENLPYLLIGPIQSFNLVETRFRFAWLHAILLRAKPTNPDTVQAIRDHFPALCKLCIDAIPIRYLSGMPCTEDGSNYIQYILRFLTTIVNRFNLHDQKDVLRQTLTPEHFAALEDIFREGVFDELIGPADEKYLMFGKAATRVQQFSGQEPQSLPLAKTYIAGRLNAILTDALQPEDLSYCTAILNRRNNVYSNVFMVMNAIIGEFNRFYLSANYEEIHLALTQLKKIIIQLLPTLIEESKEDWLPVFSSIFVLGIPWSHLLRDEACKMAEMGFMDAVFGLLMGEGTVDCDAILDRLAQLTTTENEDFKLQLAEFAHLLLALFLNEGYREKVMSYFACLENQDKFLGDYGKLIQKMLDIFHPEHEPDRKAWQLFSDLYGDQTPVNQAFLFQILRSPSTSPDIQQLKYSMAKLVIADFNTRVTTGRLKNVYPYMDCLIYIVNNFFELQPKTADLNSDLLRLQTLHVEILRNPDAILGIPKYFTTTLDERINELKAKIASLSGTQMEGVSASKKKLTDAQIARNKEKKKRKKARLREKSNAGEENPDGQEEALAGEVRENPDEECAPVQGEPSTGEVKKEVEENCASVQAEAATDEENTELDEAGADVQGEPSTDEVKKEVEENCASVQAEAATDEGNTEPDEAGADVQEQTPTDAATLDAIFLYPIQAHLVIPTILLLAQGKKWGRDDDKAAFENYARDAFCTQYFDWRFDALEMGLKQARLLGCKEKFLEIINKHQLFEHPRLKEQAEQMRAALSSSIYASAELQEQQSEGTKGGPQKRC